MAWGVAAVYLKHFERNFAQTTACEQGYWLTEAVVDNASRRPADRMTAHASAKCLDLPH